MLQELAEFFHAKLAITALGMHRGIIKEDSIATGLKLLTDDKLLVRTPVRIIHTGRLIITAIPGKQWAAVVCLLTPRRHRRMQLAAQIRRPVPIKGVELNYGSCTDVPDR